MKSSEHQPEPLQNSLNDDLHLIDQQFEQLLLRQHAVEHVRRQADAFSRLTGCEDPLSGDTEGEDEESSFPSPDFSALDEAIFQQLDQTQKKRNRSRFFSIHPKNSSCRCQLSGGCSGRLFCSLLFGGRCQAQCHRLHRPFPRGCHRISHRGYAGKCA